jgi:LacI family transcriptional regulator
MDLPITSHDVARLAGVSQATVSRALRDLPGVSVVTRGRVREASRALGYVPSHAGRSLSTQSSGRICVVSAELGNPFYPALIEPLHDALEARGYSMILMTDRGEVPFEVEALIDGSLDAVILTTSEISSEIPAQLRRRGLPFICLNRLVDGVDADSVSVDNVAGGAIAADLLAQLGHKRIAEIPGPCNTSTGRDRHRGFQDRLATLGLTLPPHMVQEIPFSDIAGQRAAVMLLENKIQPSAIFCGNDVIAMGVLNACRSLGVDVPNELTVVGFDDIPMAGWELIALTTLRVDLFSMAQTAARLAVERISEPDKPYQSVVVDPVLVSRSTHGGCPEFPETSAMVH